MSKWMILGLLGQFFELVEKKIFFDPVGGGIIFQIRPELRVERYWSDRSAAVAAVTNEGGHYFWYFSSCWCCFNTFSFHISVCERFPRFSFPSTFQFVQNFRTFLSLQQFSLRNISTLFYSFHISGLIAFLFFYISVCSRFFRRLNHPNK